MIRRLIDTLVGWSVPPEEREATLGDLSEELARAGHGWRGRWTYVHQAAIASVYGLRRRLERDDEGSNQRGGSVPGPNSLVEFAGDLRLAARTLRRTPGFTLIATITLAIGIGAAVAIFSAVNPILFEPLPYPDAGRVVSIINLSNTGRPLDMTFGTYTELRQRSRSIEVLGAADRWNPSLTGDDAATERISGQRVNAGYFPALGVQPVEGRTFTDAECTPNGPDIVIVSAGLGQRHFGRETGLVGRRIRLNGVDYEIVGVMPHGFENVLAPAADVWAPIRLRSIADFQSVEWGRHIKLVARLRRAISVEAARKELNNIAATPVPGFARAPWASLDSGVVVERLQDLMTQDVKPTLVAILGAVGLVLVIACVNVTNLLLARAGERHGELAVRAALGASRWRIVRLVVAEGLVLAFAGGALGLVVAGTCIGALVSISPSNLPRVNAIHIDGPVFVFAAAVVMVTGLVVGLVPAIGATRADLSSGLQRTSLRTAGGRQMARRSLVVAEVALALVLLVGAGLLWRSLSRLFSTTPGFDPSGVSTMQVQIAGTRYNADTARLQFFEQALAAVRAVPGITSAAFTSQLPLSGDFETFGVLTEADVKISPDGSSDACRYVVTPDYFATMHIPLRLGRLLDGRDRPGAPESVVVSESFARSRFPGQNPIGQRIKFGPEMNGERPWDVVVGVVGDVKQASLAVGAHDGFYIANGQWPWVDNVQSLVVRTTLEPASLIPAVKRAVWSIDKNQPIIRVSTMPALVDRSQAERRFASSIFQVFGLVALTLAAVGLFGVLSASVTERRREIGVRAALGASREMILRLVIGQGLALTAAGVAIGLVAAALATRAITNLLFGITRLDVPTYLAVAAVLAITSVVACWLPAWRAARVDPMEALRSE